MSRVAVKPEMLRWARERAGLQLDAFHASYAAWERGEEVPTLRQLEDFARHARVPFGYLFLPAPPAEPLPIEDFRTIKGALPARPSVDLMDVIRLMQARQDWLRDYLVASGARRLPFVGSIDLGSPVQEVAVRVRGTLGMSEGWTNRAGRVEEAVRALRLAIEEAGVMVVVTSYVGNDTRRKLNEKEFRGFALSDPYAPLIFVNGADAKSAQMFTLVHEFVHVWLGRSGVSSLPKLQASNHDVERFCDAVAAEVLVPEDELRRLWANVPKATTAFLELARTFKVSPVVVGRRALDLGLVSSRQFFSFYTKYTAVERKKAEERKQAAKEKKSGPTLATSYDTRVSRRFARFVMEAARSGDLLYRDAYRLTGLSSKTFSQYADKLGVRL